MLCAVRQTLYIHRAMADNSTTTTEPPFTLEQVLRGPIVVVVPLSIVLTFFFFCLPLCLSSRRKSKFRRIAEEKAGGRYMLDDLTSTLRSQFGYNMANAWVQSGGTSHATFEKGSDCMGYCCPALAPHYAFIIGMGVDGSGYIKSLGSLVRAPVCESWKTRQTRMCLGIDDEEPMAALLAAFASGQ